MRELLQLALFEFSGPLSMLVFLSWSFVGTALLIIWSRRRNGRQSGAVWGLSLAMVLSVSVIVISASQLPAIETSVGKVILFIRPWLPLIGGTLLALLVLGIAALVTTKKPVAAGGILLLAGVAASIALWSRFAELDETVIKHLISVPPEHQFARSHSPGSLATRAQANEIFVPAGPFIQGSLSELQMQVIVGNVEGDERPVRSTYLDSYYIDRFEVDNDSFSRFVSATEHITDAETITKGRRWGADGWVTNEDLTWREPMFVGDSIENRGSHPVVQVSWNDAVAFCDWAGKRLPTDAEWEKAARGQDSNDFPWGNEFDGTKTNFCDVSCEDLPQLKNNHYDDGHRTTAPVGSFPAGVSIYGLHDMAGNVWEWVHDAYDPYYYYYAPEVNPGGPIQSTVTHRIVRGGSFTSKIGYVRTTSKSYDPPETAYFGVGFRCARSAP